MKRVKISEFKDKLSEYLRAVEGGEEVIVTDRNRPIAHIVAVQADERALTLDEPTASFKALRTKKWSAAGWRMTGAELLAAERTET